ncbi:MAG TPA: transglycosylase domain-containing protein [Acidimicrobiia bacterium]
MRRTVALSVVIVAALIAGGCRYTSDLHLPEHQAASSDVLWSDGSLMTTLHGVEDRQPVALAAMAPTLPRAVVAIEDERFFDHDGVDARGVLRALTRDVQSGNLDQGGSTITQQYVRAVMLGPEKDLERKLREAVMAVQLEQRYSKHTILERYLNTIYFGNGAYGVQAAAHRYYATDVHTLNLAQSALLAGLIRSPEDYNPYRHPDAALARRNQVLDRLQHLHRASSADVAAARAQPLTLAPLTDGAHYPAPYFVGQVTKLILDNPAFGATRDQRRRLLLEGGLRIHTTLDPRLQALAEQSAARVLSAPATDPDAALVSLDPSTGQVKAYVGGADFWGPQPWAKIDLADIDCYTPGTGCRQAGSTFKPFVLGAALEAGVPLSRTYQAPASLTIPLPGGQPPWLVNNYDGTGSGRMDLTEATVDSVNTVYAQLVMDVGIQPVIDLAAKMGVRSPLPPVPSTALGSNGATVLDMASAYDTLAGDGIHTDPVFVTRVTTSDGTVLYRAPLQRSRAMPETTARTITGVLQQVVTRGTGVNARIGRAVAGKTGTSDNWADAWFVGYTPQLVTAVWVGFPAKEIKMRPPTTRITVTGGSWPAQIWQAYEGGALAETPVAGFPAPEAPTTTTTTRAAPAAARPPLLSAVGLSVADATRNLRQTGFQVRFVSVPSREVAPGTVVSQIPAAGRPAKPGTRVTIQVSSGPPRSLAVPSVLGDYADQAATALRAAGFEVSVVVKAEPPPGSPARAGRVWMQSPISGTIADEGTTVALSVNPAY